MISRDTLARLGLFADVPASAIDALASRAADVHFGPDEIIFEAGDSPRGWFIVVEGAVRVVRTANGRSHVIHSEGPGGTLGEVPLFTGKSYPATAIASEPTRCALLDRRALEAALREEPEIAFLLAKRLALRVQALVNRLDNRSLQSVKHRLIYFLLERRAVTKTRTISLGMTQKALAEELGTVREVLTRELQSLARRGLVASKGGGRYDISDVEALTALVSQVD